MMNVYVLDACNVDGARQVGWAIFAVSKLRGSEILAHFRGTESSLPKAWKGDDWERFERSGTADQLMSACSLDTEGLGVFNAKRGWRIFEPPGYEPCRITKDLRI